MLTQSVRTRIVHGMKSRTVPALGTWLRDLRRRNGKTLREVAASAGMDPALLSKIERGHRSPTEAQATGLARHFGICEDDLHAQRIAVDFLTHYGEHRAVKLAMALIQKSLSRAQAKGDKQRTGAT